MIVECYAADGWLMGEVLGSMRGPGPESLKNYCLQNSTLPRQHRLQSKFQHHLRRDIAYCSGGEDGEEKEECRRKR